MIRLLLATLSLFVTVFSHSSFATFIESDLYEYGDSLLTFDSENNLEWLDVTLTTGLSYNDIMNNEGGWLALGFRYASVYEVENLFTDFGIPLWSNNAPNRPEIDNLTAFLGNTLEGYTRYGVNGVTGTLDPRFFYPYYSYTHNGYGYNDSATFTRYTGYGGPDATWEYRGHFLVKEPSTFLLLGGGLAGLAFAVRRRRKE